MFVIGGRVIMTKLLFTCDGFRRQEKLFRKKDCTRQYGADRCTDHRSGGCSDLRLFLGTREKEGETSSPLSSSVLAPSRKTHDRPGCSSFELVLPSRFSRRECFKPVYLVSFLHRTRKFAKKKGTRMSEIEEGVEMENGIRASLTLKTMKVDRYMYTSAYCARGSSREVYQLKITISAGRAPLFGTWGEEITFCSSLAQRSLNY